jgi:LDH2 family malate/lactate/ureidoglycolate dehydrogenase
MPVVRAEDLHELIAAVFEAVETPPGRAAMVAEHLVAANLAGHDSHGAIRVPGYVDLIERGDIVPGAPIEVVRETDCTGVVDGHWGLGFAVTDRAVDLAVAKARSTGVAAVTVRRQSHIGRLGWYAARAAGTGMIALVLADSGRAPKVVAPLGGRERRLGTNPISIAVPSDLGVPVVLDMATSAVAQGKVRIAKARGEVLPSDCIVDDRGELTRDPSALGEYEGGALLPFGGDQAHKGYGLAFMVEVFAGLLTGIGFSHDPEALVNDGAFVAVFAVDRFQELAGFGAGVADFVAYLKDTELAAGATEILYPGEIEGRTEERRRADGIPIEATTWDRLVATATRLNVEVVRRY